ncbi:MAG: hypothetical protein GQ558_08490 [Thermoplasmata archaeon]|nr:hypothetical protein [Thermoplasmata archaeon]
MVEGGRFNRMGIWEGKEGRAIQVFGYLFVIFAIIVMAYSLVLVGLAEISFWIFILGLATDLLVAFALASFVMGIYYIRQFRHEGIVPIREVLKTILQVCLILALFFTFMVAVDALGMIDTGIDDPEDGSDNDLEGLDLAISLVLYFFRTFLGTTAAVVVVMVGGFGLMGTLYMMEVGIIPKFLLKVQDVTAREAFEDKIMMWVFNIHSALDTETILLDEPSVEKTFPWKRFRTAVVWQILFSFVVAIYISLNPWLSDDLDFDRLFRFVSVAIVTVPLLVIPWFIHLRLGSRIKGAHKDFYLYTAMRQRMVGLLITAGTLLIFVRLALENHSPEEIIMNFVEFTFMMVLLMIAFSFVYFNFFENKLAMEVYRRWMKAKEEADAVREEEVSPDGQDTE